MSAPAVKWARGKDLPQTDKSVLMAIARSHSIRWGRSAVTQSDIAKEIGVTRETVNRSILRLLKSGLLSKGFSGRKAGQWDRCFYVLAPLEGGIKAPKRSDPRVTQDHTAPCDVHQTRHRVTQDHTSRECITSRARTLWVSPMRSVANGGRHE